MVKHLLYLEAKIKHLLTPMTMEDMDKQYPIGAEARKAFQERDREKIIELSKNNRDLNYDRMIYEQLVINAKHYSEKTDYKDGIYEIIAGASNMAKTGLQRTAGFIVVYTQHPDDDLVLARFQRGKEIPL